MNVQLPSCPTVLFHNSVFLKASRPCNSLPTSVKSLGPNLFRSKATALICGNSHQVLHLCGVNPRVTSWLCVLLLRHSPSKPDYEHYCLCSCGLSKTETHILLKCDLTRASRQDMLDSIRNILLIGTGTVFTLSRLTGFSQATWNHILLFRHLKVKCPSSLQLYDAVCNFLSTGLA